MDLLRAAFGVGVALFMMVAPHLGLPYMQALPIGGEGMEVEVAGGEGDHRATIARVGLEVGPRVELKTLDAAGNRSALRVLWVELDGSKLDRGGTGAGKVQALRFVAGAPAGLRMGDDSLALKPGDEVTIEGFEGKWAYAPDGMVGILRLEGTVLAARVGDKGLRPVGTADEGVAPGWAMSGAPGLVSNVTVKAGRAAFVSTSSSDAGEELKHIKARDVRINGAKVAGTTWGEGPLDSVAFTAAGPAALEGEAGERALRDGVRVEVADFVGAYVVFFTRSDEARIALEGWAASVAFGEGSAVPSAVSQNRAPVPGFDWTPAQPRAGERVKFWDRSTDLDGRVVHREWRFGDGKQSTEQHPSHAFDQAGTYLITLLVTDNNLVTSSHARNLTILNVPPEAAWEANPASPTTLDAVQFVDASRDADGRIIAWEWDFGDGATSREQHPRHQYAANGRYEVALKVWDDDGDTDEARRPLDVRNLPPQARFGFLPADPLSGQAVQFRDGSTDPDGRVVAWAWDFGDGARSAEQHPVHAFATKGPHKVTLVARDDDGASHAWESFVDVRNRAPTSDFRVEPAIPHEGEPARFRDLSGDADGRVVERVWSFGDGSISTVAEPQHTYLAGGNLTVSLTVRDDDGARTTAVRTLTVNRRPVAGFVVAPAVPNTQEPARFTDASVDPDGRVASWAWDFGDGNTSAERQPQHRYARTGAYTVALTVTDDRGASASARRAINVSNAVPRPDFAWEPAIPVSGQNVTFRDHSTDPDGSIARASWTFGDGGGALGSLVQHAFPRGGTYPVTLTVTDNDGQTASLLKQVRVNAAPVAAFAFSPHAPTTATEVQFTDGSSDPDGALVSWTWAFGDGATSGERSPRHRFAESGLYQVRLTVADQEGGAASVVRSVVVGSLAPTAAFSVGADRPLVGQAVPFTDASSDADGAIVAWAWDFGDGARSAEQHPRHAYETTGAKRVRLTVTDDTNRTASVERVLRVFAAGPLEVVARVVYPDGQPVDLTRPGLQLELRDTLGGARLAKGEGLEVGSDGVARGVFPEGQWSAGDPVVVVLKYAAGQVDQTTTRALPADGALGTIVMRSPLQGRVQLAPPMVGSGATYQDPTQQVRGLVVLAWRDGTPVRGATVTLSYEWQPGLLGLGPPVPLLDASSGATDEAGAHAFAVPFTLGLADGPGSYLPGQYRIVARAEHAVSDGLASWRATSLFHVDPLGARGALRG